MKGPDLVFRSAVTVFVGANGSGEATLISFDHGRLTEVTLQETSHYQITRDILEAPERYWRHLLREGEVLP